MSQTVKSLKKVSGLSKKTGYGAPLTKKPSGDSGDYLQAFTAGTVAPEDPKMKKVRTAPVADDELAKMTKRKEQERKRKKTGLASTMLTGSSSLG